MARLSSLAMCLRRPSENFFRGEGQKTTSFCSLRWAVFFEIYKIENKNEFIVKKYKGIDSYAFSIYNIIVRYVASYERRKIYGKVFNW